MKIGILSDTHSLPIPPELLERLKSVDMIIHAGDICDLKTLKLLQNTAPTKAVQGNMDEWSVKQVLPLKEMISCEGLKIGVIHGYARTSREALKNATDAFKDDKMDVVIFGHSHHPFNKKVGETLYFNPGSPADVVGAPYHSYGLITIEAGKVKAEILEI